LGRLAEHIKEQDDSAAEASRVEVIHFSEDGERIQRRATCSELRDMLDSPSSGQTRYDPFDFDTNQMAPVPTTNYKPVRRIFLVEDVSRNYMGILGSRLRIPPIFFAKHLLELSVLEQFQDEEPANNIESFTLPFFQFARAPKVSSKQPLEEMYRVKANATRLFAFPKPYGSFDLRGTIIEVEHCFSFWSRKKGDDDWDGRF
jgi:hypothetical protein